MPWFPRKCTWCGTEVAARTDDPDVIVVCLACDPGDLPLSVDAEDTATGWIYQVPAGNVTIIANEATCSGFGTERRNS